MIPRTPGSSWVFVPSSDVSHEEDRWQCAKCTELHGPIEPNQAVRVDMCSGVIPSAETQPGESS